MEQVVYVYTARSPQPQGNFPGMTDFCPLLRGQGADGTFQVLFGDYQNVVGVHKAGFTEAFRPSQGHLPGNAVDAPRKGSNRYGVPDGIGGIATEKDHWAPA